MNEKRGEVGSPVYVKVDNDPTCSFIIAVALVVLCSILGSLAADVKRIANALERQHPPAATIQRLPEDARAPEGKENL